MKDHIAAIDTATARQLADAGSIRGVQIIAGATGWYVVLQVGMQERILSKARSRIPRTWQEPERVLRYVRTLGIADVTVRMADWTNGQHRIATK